MKKQAICLLLLNCSCLCPQLLHAAADPSIVVIGQDTKSIDGFMTASKAKNLRNPDGFMVYTAINDMRGIWDPVDQGAGTNYADQTIKDHPQFHIVQVGLYMRYMLGEIVNGTFDKSIDGLGQWIKACGKDVYLRIGYEFDNPENGYDPAQYIAAYRYIVDRLRNDDVRNVYFVWHSIAWTDKGWPAYDPMKWYPGDTYVDWMGISFFDAAHGEDRQIMAKIARSKNKPLMISESSPFKQYTVEEKLKWMKALFQYIQVNHVPFLSYINVDWGSLPMFAAQKWGDARLEHSAVLMAVWAKETELKRI